MIELVMRAVFLLVCAGIGFTFSGGAEAGEPPHHLMGIGIAVAIALAIIALEWMLSQRPIQSIGAIVFGLITGCLLAMLFYYIFQLADIKLLWLDPRQQQLLIVLSLAVICCYACVMVIYKTRDRFRFIIPYVEFQKEEKGRGRCSLTPAR